MKKNFGEFARENLGIDLRPNDDNYINFGDFARNVLGQQCQYASRYVDGRLGSENLGVGLRFKETDTGSYHDIKIHKDDVGIFEQRYRKHMRELLE